MSEIKDEGLSSKEKIIRTTSELLENQGYHGTGIAQIVKESGAPKGSVYFHFPGGKEEIASEAVAFAGTRTAARVRESLTSTKRSAESLRMLIEDIAFHVEESGFQAGGPILIVASEMATQSETLNTACRRAYELTRLAIREKLESEGLRLEIADTLATTVMATIEGGIVLSRTYHSGDTLRQIAENLEYLIDQIQSRESMAIPGSAAHPSAEKTLKKVKNRLIK